jgi:hypothetical protein
MLLVSEDEAFLSILHIKKRLLENLPEAYGNMQIRKEMLLNI